jgi:N6-adenosine-specific RNA methylase IME4
VAGYSFGLGFAKIKWLLEDDRWRQCGFANLEDFAASIQFDKSIKAAAEQRKELAILFKKADEARPISNKKIALALNVDPSTIDEDVRTGKPAPSKKQPTNNSGPGAGNPAPSLPSGERAARHIANKAESQEVKRERRDAREQAAAGRILALPNKQYGVIWSDPEWREEVWSREIELDRAPDNHYSTSPEEVIKSRPVASIAAAHSVLYLWLTIQHLAIAIDVMRAWGFTYKSHVIWRKPSMGLGRWVRSRHEILLIGTHGSPPAPAPGTQWESVIDADRGAHSEKPATFYGIVEAHYPSMPKIELNARRRRPGWDPWGLETPSDPYDAQGVH